jgi:rhamnosyltransferase
VDLGLTRQGAGMNFMSLLNVVESQYYMFCDQDDVWLPNKIEKEFSQIKKLEEELGSEHPIIVHTDRTFVDKNLNVICKSELNPRGISEKRLAIKLQKMKNPNILSIYTIVGGCIMLFNHKVKQLVFPFINIRIHDFTCAMTVANNKGSIYTITESTMLYRLHDSNTCGVSSSKILPKLFHIYQSLKKNMKGYYIWKFYGKGGFCKFLYYRIKYFFILRFY